MCAFVALSEDIFIAVYAIMNIHSVSYVKRKKNKKNSAFSNDGETKKPKTKPKKQLRKFIYLMKRDMPLIYSYR